MEYSTWMGELDTIWALRREGESTRKQLKIAARAAVEAGAKKNQVAEAAGISRPTLDAWLREPAT